MVALLIADHQHHRASAELMMRLDPGAFAIAAHSFAEVYNTLTRPTAFGVDPKIAWAALDSLSHRIALLGLTEAQTLDTISAYAAIGGVGPRLYDRLIGEVAVVQGIKVIVTWNAGHMRGLFPRLDVMTPQQFIEAHAP